MLISPICHDRPPQLPSQAQGGRGLTPTIHAGPAPATMAAAAAFRVGLYLHEHRNHHISWHTILNNHASTRPGIHGGKIVDSVTRCKEYKAPGSASAEWEYAVSRRLAQRFEYSKDSRAGFVELAPDRILSPR